MKIETFHIPNLLLGLVLLSNIFNEIYAKQPKDDGSIHIQKMVEWLRSKPNGFISSRIEIRRSDTASYFGIFASHDIKKHELLLRIPDEMKIQIDDPDHYIHDVCELSWLLKEEFEKEDESLYAPYINYLRDQPRGQLPAMWSDGGKALLLKVQGSLLMNDYMPNVVHGEHIITWMEEYFEYCMTDEETSETLDPHFLALVVQRGFDQAMIPIYDMINHNRGKVNTIASVYSEESLDMYATRDILAGEELFYAYHDTPDSESTPDYWGTPEMLRDFGFVEAYPHRFHFAGGLSFTIEEGKDTMNGKASLELKWWNDKVSLSEMHTSIIKDELERLGTVFNDDIIRANSSVPDQEYDTIVQYHQAISTALELLLGTYEKGPENSDEEDESSSSDDHEDDDDDNNEL